MLEILKIIILACQINPGVGGSISEVHAYQVKCQKEIIKCANGKVKSFENALYDCILERKETL
jgi:hypothetical protein